MDINFLQGKENKFSNIENDSEEERIKIISDKITELFNMKNIHFLFGSGTSNGAIPVMKELFKKVKIEVEKLEKPLQNIFESIKLEHPNDFEELLGILYSKRNLLENLVIEQKVELKNCTDLIAAIEKCVFDNINVKMIETEPKKVLEHYKDFYLKVSLRNRDLSRINVFTTNNDLFNENALDNINISYINGFNGGLNRFFNPAFFNYSFSKRMDTSIDKYEPVENMVYLYKLHGSINWLEKESQNSFFDICENVSEKEIIYNRDNNVLIYPTPTKQDKSLSSPYTELFREFQKKLLKPQSVLFIIGYGFNDSHVNNIIHQALATNSSLNIFIFKEHDDNVQLFKVNDSRIFKVWGKKEDDKIHYFKFIVENLIPDVNQYKNSNNILQEFIKQIKNN